MSNETPLNETDMDGLKEIEKLGFDFRNDYKNMNIFITNIINRFHRYILKPTLQDKTVECNTKISFISENERIYNSIRENNNKLPVGYILPDGYFDTTTFLNDYDTYNAYVKNDCPDVYKVEFHQNMYKFYNTDELAVIRTKYNNLVNFQNTLIEEQMLDTTDIFAINVRLNAMIKALLAYI